MNKEKEEMLERIATMEAELDQMRKLANSKLDYKRWFPKVGEEYFSFYSDGEVDPWYSNQSGLTQEHYDLGIVFKTKQEARRHVRILKAKRRVLDLILKYNEGWTPDWTFDWSGAKLPQGKQYFALSHDSSYHIQGLTAPTSQVLPNEYYMKDMHTRTLVYAAAGDDIYALFDMEKGDLPNKS